MGVQSLWQILAPVKSEESIESLKGKKIAVDLAIWLVESQVTGIKMMQGRVIKPHLRNLFFRVSNFLRLGVKLVFVIDGTPPELKWGEIARRNEARLGGGGGGRGGWGGKGRGGGQRGGGVKKASRSHFSCWLKECQELLELMGVPCIQSKGEAEAMCAALNSSGIVDGCMTEDGDAFLYGARTVYRNLNMATGKVDCYCMDDIETDLNLDRRRLVALAILLGCDYLPKGVPGIGKEVAMRFMKSLPSSDDPLNLFQDWSGGCDSTCLTNEERDVRKKSVRVEGFPNQDVIKEFLQNKERPPTRHNEWRRPLLLHLQQFNMFKMEWPIEYTQEKVVPLMTLYDLTHMTSDPKGRLTPASVIKLRVRQGVPCVEVKWHKPEEDKENDEDCNPFYTTVEERELFTSAFPDVMEQFMVAMEMKKAKGRGKKKKETSSSSQQEGSTVDDHRVVMDTASKHPCDDFHVPFTLDQEHPLKVHHTSSQVEKCHGNKIRSRELESLHGTGGDRAGRSRAPSQEVTHCHSGADEEEILRKLINLSLHDSRLEMSLRGGGEGARERGGGARVELRREEGGRCSGKIADVVQEDETRLKRMPVRDNKAKPGKKCLRGRDLNLGKEFSRGITHEGMSSLKSKSLPVGLGTKERTMTKDNVLVTKVTEDIDTEGKEKEKEGEEEESSFIEVLPLSQRLGCHSLRGFIPNSRRIGNHHSLGASSNAAKSIDHLSDDESDLGMQNTIPQLCDEESQDTSPGDIRSLEFTIADNAKAVGRTKHSRGTFAGSKQPSLAIAAECCGGRSPENIMDQGKSMTTEATEIIAKLYIPHPKDKLKSTLECNQETKVSKVHTPCHKLTSATCEVIDLTEDSPLKNQHMSAHTAVYSAAEAEETDGQSLTARALGVQSRSLVEKEGDNNSTYSDEDIPYFQEKPVHERLLHISVGNGKSTYSIKNNESSFMKLDNSLANFMNELSLASNSTSVAASFAEIDDSVFIVEDEEPCLDDDKQEKTNLEENNEEKTMEFVNVCQGTVLTDSGKVKKSYSLSEVSLGVPEGISVVPEKEVDTKVTESEQPVQGEVEESTDLHSRETKHFHVFSDSETTGNLDLSTVTNRSRTVKFKDTELSRKETKNISGEILDQLISSSLDSSEATVQETCEPQQHEGVLDHPSISRNEMGNVSPSLHVETNRRKSRKGRVSKTKKMHKLMQGGSLHDSVLIENGLMKILQMMSPVTCLSHSGRRQETGQLSEASEDSCSQSSCLASQNGRPCPELVILSPSSSSSSATASSSFSTSGSTSIVTSNLPGPDGTATSDQTPLSIPEEPPAILANSATGAHTVSPCTKSSHLLREQLLSMLSQLTPGDSPLMGSKVLQKPTEFKPPCVGRQKFSSEGKRRIHSEPVQDDPTCMPCSDILKESTQRTITDVIDGMCECSSIKSNMSLEGTNSPPKVCVGDSSSSIQESHSVRTRAVSMTVNEPRPKLKPRSLSQPSRTVLSVNAKRNRSKHKSCFQPVGSRNRSISKTSLKGSQRRESMLAMECNLAKILEGLSFV